MRRDDIRGQVRDILSLVLRTELPADGVDRDRLAAWDSLRHVEVIFAVEEAFDIQFTQDEMADARSLDALVGLVEHHLAA